MANIMVVDDSSIIRKTLTTQLEEMGHKVIYQAQDGRYAVNNYIKYKPDVVTMDITMPVLNGLLALKEIMHLDEKAKVIMITSHGEESLVMDAIDAGAIGYVLKPVTTEKLEQQLKKID